MFGDKYTGASSLSTSNPFAAYCGSLDGYGPPIIEIGSVRLAGGSDQFAERYGVTGDLQCPSAIV